MEFANVLQIVLLAIATWVVKELHAVTVVVATITARLDEHERRLSKIAARLELDAE